MSSAFKEWLFDKYLQQMRGFECRLSVNVSWEIFVVVNIITDFGA